jgi:hypothetical protein
MLKQTAGDFTFQNESTYQFEGILLKNTGIKPAKNLLVASAWVII